MTIDLETSCLEPSSNHRSTDFIQPWVSKLHSPYVCRLYPTIDLETSSNHRPLDFIQPWVSKLHTQYVCRLYPTIDLETSSNHRSTDFIQPWVSKLHSPYVCRLYPTIDLETSSNRRPLDFIHPQVYKLRVTLSSKVSHIAVVGCKTLLIGGRSEVPTSASSIFARSPSATPKPNSKTCTSAERLQLAFTCLGLLSR